MAKTPYGKLGSEDILSAHITGIQSDINKIQDVLNMKTGSKTNHTMVPVQDQEDPSLRFRIYEATERNWLKSPKPVIKKNGVNVNESEYIIQESYGVIVFHEQQLASDTITADFSHIIGASKVIEDIGNDITSLDNKYDGLDTRVETLESNPGGGGGGGDTLTLGGVVPYYPYSGSYITHMNQFYNPFGEDNDYNRESHTPMFNILVNALTLDAFPMPISRRMTIREAGIMLGEATNYSVRTRIGLYKDNGNLRPGELLFDTADIIVAPGEWGYADVNKTVEPGLYWIARHDKSSSNYNGLRQKSVINIQRFNGETFMRNLADRPNPFTIFGGYRASNVPWEDGGNLPKQFPSDAELFRRSDYASPWLIVD